MKFLVSPSFRYSGNLRRMLLALLVFLFFFNTLYGLSFVLQSPAIESESLLGEMQTPYSIEATRENKKVDDVLPGNGLSFASEKAVEKFKLALLEGIHIDLFVFSLEYLLFLSLYLQLEKKAMPRHLALHGIPLLLLAWIVLRFLYSQSYGLFCLAMGFFFYTSMQFLAATLIYKMYLLKE